jgi:hypothetical protein
MNLPQKCLSLSYLSEIHLFSYMFLVVTIQTAASNDSLHTASRISIMFREVWEWREEVIVVNAARKMLVQAVDAS